MRYIPLLLLLPAFTVFDLMPLEFITLFSPVLDVKTSLPPRLYVRMLSRVFLSSPPFMLLEN